jgi:hypothetical protein
MSDATEDRIPLPLFTTGQVVATPGALSFLRSVGVEPIDLITRHVFGDWSDLSPEDQVQNCLAVARGGRIFTSFSVGHTNDLKKVWVITEADRRSTSLLLPRDY